MEKYLNYFVEGYTNYFSYLKSEVLNPSWHNYFYWLILVSFVFLLLEVVIPWRRKQAVLRKDFWLDVFYMFFNFFLFSLIIYSAASNVVVNLFNDSTIWITGFNLQANNPMRGWPMWAILLVGFVVRDFVQWWIHRLLHRSDRLWNFHKVHHSVEQMGFAAHLRYHWMENIIYRSLEYIPLAFLGIGLYDFFIIHIFTLAWGHYNHANIHLSSRVTGGIVGCLLGVLIANSLIDINLVQNPTLDTQIAIILAGITFGSLVLSRLMKYLFNSPEMHIWHHAYELPHEHRYGVNFGLTLAIWDYLFGTAYIPTSGQYIRLGFPGVEAFPHTFGGQAAYGVLGRASKDDVATKDSSSISD